MSSRDASAQQQDSDDEESTAKKSPKVKHFQDSAEFARHLLVWGIACIANEAMSTASFFNHFENCLRVCSSVSLGSGVIYHNKVALLVEKKVTMDQPTKEDVSILWSTYDREIVSDLRETRAERKEKDVKAKADRRKASKEPTSTPQQKKIRADKDRANMNCRFWMKTWSCKKGDACEYRHPGRKPDDAKDVENP